MGPKPVRIGLKKKHDKTASWNDEFGDVGNELRSEAVSVADPVKNSD